MAKAPSLRRIAALVPGLRGPHFRALRAGLPRARIFAYHIGFLMVDRLKDKYLDKVASILLKRSDEGTIFLTQKRLGDGRYIYLATEPEVKK